MAKPHTPPLASPTGFACRSLKPASPQEIITELRQVDVRVSQGCTVADAIRSIAVTEVTVDRWRQEHGGLEPDRVRRMRELDTEDSRLRKAVADLTLDKLISQKAARGSS